MSNHGNSSIDNLKEIGHKVVTIAELTNILAQQSPMMPIVGYDEDKGGPVCLNGIRVDDSGDRPVFILYFSEYAKKNDPLYDIQSHDERVAEKRNLALDMAKASREHMAPIEG